ncbi:MAG: site-2 protease family protein [Halobacteriales archaeon]|nr:site-2 protease family protein [Halobacteriales archaeon]
MGEVDSLDGGPPVEAFAGVFDVYETRRTDDQLIYFGEPRAPREHVMERVWPLFRERGYEVMLTERTGEHVLVAEPVDVGVDGIPWTNVILFVATVGTTLFAGSAWYHLDLSNPLNALAAWPFVVAVLGVLGIHELGHYVMSRYHNVDATLPYFIPIPTFIGTMGAVIRMKGQIPDRRALFDIGVAGPLAGLAATIIVTAIGLMLPPIPVPEASLQQGTEIELGLPPLFHAIAFVVGEPITYSDPGLQVNPVVFGGWVGMFVTFLNLIPVGQLDGGHIVRAVFGKRQETVAAAVPMALFALAGYLFYFEDVSTQAVGLWVFWGLFAMLFAFVGPATPVQDGTLDNRRKLVGLLTLVLGLACFTPIPVEIVG